MRILKLAAAIGLMVGSLGLTTAASAQHNGDVRIESQSDYNRHVLGRGDGSNINPRYDNRRDDRRYGRSARRDDRGYNRSDRRNWRRDGYRSSRACKTVWRHHRRVRVCR
jgi:hypothetical protein